MGIRNIAWNAGENLMELGISAAIVAPAIVVGLLPEAGNDKAALALTTAVSSLSFIATLPISAPLYSTGYILRKLSGL